MNAEILFGQLINEPKVGDILSPEIAMKLAIQEGFKGLGFVSPNPLVGCVILDSENKFLAKGHHAKFGEGHAEVNALKGLSREQLKGAKLFVTLEPCAHEGKTPSCAKAIAQLPVKEVTYGLVDPNPMTAGQGAEILKAAGIKAHHLENQNLIDACEQLCEHFLWNYREKKIFVSLKVASSLDGIMALKNGESQWITDETSRAYAHELRASHEAVMVGVGTLKQDNPSLNIRHQKFPNKQNKVVIVDTHGWALQNRTELKLFKQHAPENLIFMVGEKANVPEDMKSQVMRLPLRSSLDLGLGLESLWQKGIKSLLVEGGAKLLSSFILEKRAQRLYLFQAPIILGAGSGRSWSEQVTINSMSQKMTLKNHVVRSLNQDHLFTGRWI